MPDHTVGLDEPMGCYEDIDNADVFVTWGNNMAEMHPVLFSRMLANRKSKMDNQIIDLTTRPTRSSLVADKSILFNPQSDLAIANAICYEIVKNNWVNADFVSKHVSFLKDKTNIGLIVPGLAPSPMGELISYSPSNVELFITVGILGLGMFVVTLLLRPALIIEQRYEDSQKEQ